MTLLTQREAAAALRISQRSLERMRVSGASGLRFVRVGRRSVRYREEDIADYVAARTVRSTSEQVRP
jgi:excisionase family DNA binding protein